MIPSPFQAVQAIGVIRAILQQLPADKVSSEQWSEIAQQLRECLALIPEE